MAVKPSSIESAVVVSGTGYALPVSNVDGTSVGGGGTADQTTFTGATTVGTVIEGVYQTTPDTIANNKSAAIAIDANRNVKVTEATLLAGENLTTNRLNNEPIYSFANILTATTTTVKSGAGTLHSITFNKPVLSEVWTLYDNTAGSGTKIGTITLPATLVSQGPMTAIYDVSFATGLTIVSGSTTDGTIAFR